MKKTFLPILPTLIAAALAAGPACATVSIAPDEKALKIDGGGSLKFSMGYPSLLGEDGKVVHKLIEQSASTGATTLKYEGGGQATLTVNGGTVKVKFSGLAGDVKKVFFNTLINFNFSSGGQWKFDSGALKPFPEQKPPKPHLFQNHARTFTILADDSNGLLFTVPPYSYNELTDNREWNWKIFAWKFTIPFNPDNPVFDLKIEPTDAAAATKTTVTENKPAAPQAPAIAATEKGVAVTFGSTMKFTLEYPHLLGADQKEIHKIIEKSAGGSAATLKYEGGGQAVITIDPDGSVKTLFSGLDADVKNVTHLTLVNFNFADGGEWKFDDAPAQPFPAAQQPKPHLFQNHASVFTIRSNDGSALSFTTPPNSYNELTDNRAWGWKIFAWKYNTPFNPMNPSQVLKIAVPSDTGAVQSVAMVQVDKFGQSTRHDWPDKVKSEEELKADVAADEAYYASFQPPQTDTYGGLPGSGEKLHLKKTGFFHMEKSGEKWVLVDPDGNAFFHLAVGCFTTPSYTYIAGRKQIYEWLPSFDSEYKSAYLDGKDASDFSFYSANYIRKFGKPYDKEEGAALMINRVRKWGFNSSGPFTSPALGAYKAANFPYVSHLPLEPWNGFPPVPGLERVFDPFVEGIEKKMDALFAARVAPMANDPLLIGYFIANEPIYEDIPRGVSALKGKFACKQRLVQMLKEKYSSLEKFNEAWKLKAKSFDELNDTGLAVTTPQAAADMKEYTRLFLDRLFDLTSAIFHKYDKNHLLIGNRLQFGTINNETLCGLMGKYLDVVSFNYYTNGFDSDFMNKVYKWTGGKPMILSEFYWSAPADSGLPGGVKDVENQEQRGLAYRNYVEKAASLGYIVGIEWFTLIDQSVTGNWFSKYGGENGNTGLFAVTDRPWKKMIGHMVKTNYAIYDVELDGKAPFAYDNPLFKFTKGGQRIFKISRATGPVKLNGSVENWPGLPAEDLGSRVVTGAGTGGVGASFKACWDDRNFYFLINVTDPTPMKNDRVADNIWMGDAVELFFGHDQINEAGSPLPGDRHLIVSAGLKDGKAPFHFINMPAQPACETAVIPNVDGKGYTMEIAVPFDSLGFKPKAGDTILFDIGLDDSADGKSRDRQFMWNGTERNSQERSGWGKATFILQ